MSTTREGVEIRNRAHGHPRRIDYRKGKSIMKATMALMAALAWLTATPVSAQGSEPNKSVQLPGSKDARVTLVYQHALPGVPGKSMKGVLVEYGPGGYSPSHTHARTAIIYATVLEGEVRSKVNDGPVTTYRAGENWTELPGDHHGVSANASDSHPAKILAVFIVDDDETELTIPDSR